MNKPITTSTSSGWSNLAFAMARITQVFWEDMRCNVLVLTGEDSQPRYEGVNILMPYAGARMFLGGIPEVGDICVLGWYASNTTGKANKKSPAIVGWMPRSTFLGHDWLPTQDFSNEEGILNNPKERKEAKAVVNRRRHKLRHYSPGNIGASSSQGSDLVLDESVLISNRRANEIKLRDQDQAIVMRSLQQFHSTAGTRIYSGMVQRDSRTLPKEMFISTLDFNQDFLFDQEGDIQSVRSDKEINLLDPHPLFLRNEDGNLFENQGGKIQLEINPYKFLYDSKLIDINGKGNTLSGDIYGGKSILRINKEGSVLNSEDSDALCEYRIEVAHTSDGTLPVSEQSDGFDADRLLNVNNLPFVQFALGTPVGNDPITDQGIITYGKPLYMQFDGEDVSLDAITEFTPLEEQLATLISVSPLIEGLEDSISGYTKGGAYRSFISSDLDDAFKSRIEGGLEASIGKTLNISSNGLEVITEGSSNADANIIFNSLNGAIHLRSTGVFTPNQANEGDASFDPELSRVGVKVESTGVVELKSESGIVLKAPILDMSDVSNINLNTQTALSLSSGDQIVISTKQKKDVITGKYERVITGPTDFNPLNSPPKSETIGANPTTGFVGGVVDSYTCAYGDKVSNFLTTSNVSTNITSGSYNVTVLGGAINHVAGTTSINQNPSGIAISSATGSISINNAGGVVSVNSGVSTNIRSVGVSSLSGSSVILGSAGAGLGFIMCATDRDPITGRTFLESGLMLPRGQLLFNAPV